MRGRLGIAVPLLALSLLAACQGDVGGASDPATSPERPRASSAPEVVTPLLPSAKPLGAPSSAPTRKPASGPVLLRAARGGDGDSWKDTAGVEYRLGLVNTPELSECYGQTASATRKRLTAAGFRAKVYSADSNGRRVAEVILADGRNLNVYLARNGFADDRYLEEFRHENRSLAAQLDAAFAAARRERAGLWGACAAQPQAIAAPPPAAQQPAAPASGSRGNCDSSYPDVCIPPGPPDLDCGDISHRRFRVLAPDPHRFDANRDGLGCESG